MTDSDRLKAWAARKRDRARGTTPAAASAAAPSSPARDQGLRDRSYALVEGGPGRACPKGSSVPVKAIAYWHAVERKSPVEIVARFAGELTFAQCHAALAYYHLHKAEFDAALARDGERNGPEGLAGAGRLPRVGLRGLAAVLEE